MLRALTSARPFAPQLKGKGSVCCVENKRPVALMAER
jgi:hypothetical protein